MFITLVPSFCSVGPIRYQEINSAASTYLCEVRAMQGIFKAPVTDCKPLRTRKLCQVR